MAKMNMNVEQDLQGTEEHRQSKRNGRKSAFYSALPVGKTQGIHYNKLYFGVFSPASWPLFQERKGVTLANSIPADIGSFYWRLYVHYRKVRMPDGSHRDMPVLCPNKQNAYHVDILKYNPLFADGKCRICEEAAAMWSKFDAEWQRVTYNGQPLGDRWSMNHDQFKQTVGGNPVLQALHEEANAWGCQVRYAFMVLDLSKLFGERKLDADEQNVQFEPFIGPKAVFDGLHALLNTGVRFYDDANPQIVCLTKDTTKGVRFSKYAVSSIGSWPIDPAYRAYIADDNNMPVLTGGRPGEEDAQFLVLSYQEQRELLDMQGEPGTCQASSAQHFGMPGVPAPAPHSLVQPYGAGQVVAPYTPPQPYGAVPQMAPPQPVYAPPSAPQPVYAPPQPVAPPAMMQPPVYAPPVAAPQPGYAPPAPMVAPQPPAAPGAYPQAPAPLTPSFVAPSAAPHPTPVAAPMPAPAPAPAQETAPAPVGEAGGPKPRSRRANW